MMATLFERLRLAIEQQIGPGIDVFQPGTPREEVEAALAETGLDLPNSYIEFLAAANGQAPDTSVLFPPGQLRFLSTDEALSQWRALHDFEDDEDQSFF